MSKSFFNKMTPSKKTKVPKNNPQKTLLNHKIIIEPTFPRVNKLDKITAFCLKLLAILPFIILLGGLWWVLYKFFPEAYAIIGGKFKGIWQKIQQVYDWLTNKVDQFTKLLNLNWPRNKTKIFTILLGTIGTGLSTHVLKKTITSNLFLKLGVGSLKWFSRGCFWVSMCSLGYEIYQLKNQKPATTSPATPLQEQVPQTTSQTTPTKSFLEQFQDAQKKKMSP
ncbi:hypothetical protein [Candidatus Phytoplasma oryzae]|nr:hypothetical protein PIE28_01925 [Candidatus Phytoplasma oryzae]